MTTISEAIQTILFCIAELEAENERLTELLADALSHCPDSYTGPIMEVLRRKAASAAERSEKL